MLGPALSLAIVSEMVPLPVSMSDRRIFFVESPNTNLDDLVRFNYRVSCRL